MGFIVLLPVLFLLVIGAGVLLALATAAHVRKRNPVYTGAWVGAGVVSTLALAFSLIMFFSVGQAAMLMGEHWISTRRLWAEVSIWRASILIGSYRSDLSTGMGTRGCLGTGA
ncbi:hypothetical protein [Deinococcus sedimenti]|nr:hypothetical protein [Deinococcus sedimenti]